MNVFKHKLTLLVLTSILISLLPIGALASNDVQQNPIRVEDMAQNNGYLTGTYERQFVRQDTGPVYPKQSQTLATDTIYYQVSTNLTTHDSTGTLALRGGVSVPYHFYKYTSATTLSTDTNFGDATVDDEMVLVRYEGNLTVTSGAILSTQVRKRGLVIYVAGNLTINSGTISMTDRGAANVSTQTLTIFDNAGSAVQLSGANAGAGGAGGTSESGAYSGGVGTSATVYSGGTGGGGAMAAGSIAYTPFDGANGNAGSSNGGSGGLTAGGMFGRGSGAGSGNPYPFDYAGGGDSGTGGLLIIIVNGATSLTTTTLTSVGSRGGNGSGAYSDGDGGGVSSSPGGGGSGGGIVRLYYKGSLSGSPTTTVTGGGGGSNGGAGASDGVAGSSGSYAATQMLADAATVETHSPATSITSTTAIVEGHVTDDGGDTVTDRGICWDTSTNPTIASSHTHNGTGTGTFTGSLTSLSTGTTYHSRAFATNANSTVYGNEVDFLTIPAAPTGVSATDGTSTTNVTVTWNASTGASGYYVYRDATEVSVGNVVRYDDTVAAAPTITAGTASASDGTSATFVTLSIAGETGNNGTSYTYKVKAINATGNSSDSSTNTGYRGTTTLTYQWMRTSADADVANTYSNIAGGTTDPYNDTGAPADGSGRYFKALVSMTSATSSNTTSNRGWRSVPVDVTTQAATSVEETTATGNGNITNLNGGDNCTERGMDYDIDSGSPYTYNAHDHGSYATGAFTTSLTSLSKGTYYYARAYAMNSFGYGYGSEVTFLTKPDEPNSFVCTTVNSTAISYTFAKGTGAVYTIVKYAAGAYPATVADGALSYNGTGTSFTQGSLSDATNYYFRAWSWVSSGALSQYSDSYGQCTSLTSNPPSVTSIAATSVEETTATTNANITYSPATISVWGVQYGTSGSYGSWDNTSSNPGVPYLYSKALAGLIQGELYYFRGFAVNSVGSGYGSQLTFLTKPEVTTGFSISTVNSTALSANWTKGTGALNTYILYKDGGYPVNYTDPTATLAYNGTGVTWVQGGLIDGHTYYFKAWSWASEGGLSQYSDSDATGFGTTGSVPSVTTIAASSVEETTASVSGNATFSSNNINNKGADYGTTIAFGSSVNSVAGLPVAAPHYYTLSLTTLSPGTYYYFRPFADNGFGRGYGTTDGFLTKPNAPTGLTLTVVNTTAISLSWTKGTGASYTYIRYSNTTYPATIATGTLAANTTATTFVIGGLTSTEVLYVSAWALSFGNTSQQYSDTYATALIGVPSGVPIVTTNGSTGYGNNWATVTGQVHNTYPPPTLYGFQYGTSVAYGSTANTTTVVGSGVFATTITGLSAATTYHYRAWAENSYGTGYGADMTFTTGGTEVLYENYLYGCNTTWSSVYETDASSISVNWTSGVPMNTSSTPIYGQNWTAQTFTTTDAHSIHQVVLWASRTSTAAAGYIYVSIREATTDNVTTPDLGIGLYAISYVSTSGGAIEVSLENEIQLDANKKYAIIVRAPGADATNYVSIISSNTTGSSIYADGNAIRSINGGASWVSYTGYDLYFSVIGRPQPIYANIMAAQTFTVGAQPHTSYKVRLIMGRVGQPGNIYISLRNYTGGVLSSADIAVVALNGNAVTLDKASYDCIFTPEKSLEAGKQYAIVISAPSGDRYNYILMCADTGGGYAGGTALLSINSGQTWVAKAFDYNFEIWGNTVLSVLNAKVFKNYLTTGDWLICAEVLNITPPYYDLNEDPSAYFVLSFMGLTGTTYASTPCSLWEKSPVVIYLNPTQAQALTWGGNYMVRITNLSGTVYSEYGLLPGDWNAASLTYLDNWVRLVANDMGTYKTARTGTTTTYVTYVANKGYVLNENGGAIFNQACPRLSYVRPNLFQITSNQPDITTTSVSTPGSDAMNPETRLGSYLYGIIVKFGVAMGIQDAKYAGGVLMVIGYFIIAFGTVIKGFAWAGMIGAAPVLLLGMYYGLLNPQLFLIILVILALLFVREFIFKGG